MLFYALRFIVQRPCNRSGVAATVPTVEERADFATHRRMECGRPVLQAPDKQVFGERRMDFGIRGRRAVVCGASQGLGYACALALAREGVVITLIARKADTIAAAAKRIAD